MKFLICEIFNILSFEFRILIQQLYLQVCNIGKNLKEEMSNQQMNDMNAINKNFIHTIETHLEMFTKKQTVIIEKWSRAEAKTKEELKEKEKLRLCQQEIQKLLNDDKNRIAKSHSLFDENVSCVNSNQNFMMESKILVSNLKRLICEGNSYLEKLTGNDRDEVKIFLNVANKTVEKIQVFYIYLLLVSFD